MNYEELSGAKFNYVDRYGEVSVATLICDPDIGYSTQEVVTKRYLSCIILPSAPNYHDNGPEELEALKKDFEFVTAQIAKYDLLTYSMNKELNKLYPLVTDKERVLGRVILSEASAVHCPFNQ